MPSLRTPPREDVKTEPVSDDDDDYMDPNLRILHDFNKNRGMDDTGAGPSHAFPGSPPIYALRSLMKRQREHIEEAIFWKKHVAKRARLSESAKKEESSDYDYDEDDYKPLGELYPEREKSRRFSIASKYLSLSQKVS